MKRGWARCCSPWEWSSASRRRRNWLKSGILWASWLAMRRIVTHQFWTSSCVIASFGPPPSPKSTKSNSDHEYDRNSTWKNEDDKKLENWSFKVKTFKRQLAEGNIKKNMSLRKTIRYLLLVMVVNFEFHSNCLISTCTSEKIHFTLFLIDNRKSFSWTMPFRSLSDAENSDGSIRQALGSRIRRVGTLRASCVHPTVVDYTAWPLDRLVRDPSIVSQSQGLFRAVI